MRELSTEELHFVAGGRFPPLPPTTLEGITVRPPRGSGGSSFGPPPSVGGGSHGGGPSSSPNSGAGNGLTPQQLAGIARIKDQLGVDVTAYAKMSPSLAQAISTATSTYHFNFDWQGDSHTNWSDQVNGTVSINSAAKTDMLYFLQQLAHELGHVDHRVADRASQTPAEVYVTHLLEAEGHATLLNESVQHEIYSAGGGDIHIAGKAGNRAFYDAEYSRWTSGQQTHSQATRNIGAYYGQHENTQGYPNYHDYYMSEHRRLGGYQ
jgi:hypothetical protein